MRRADDRVGDGAAKARTEVEVIWIDALNGPRAHVEIPGRYAGKEFVGISFVRMALPVYGFTG